VWFVKFRLFSGVKLNMKIFRWRTGKGKNSLHHIPSEQPI
jgi:hypothetical protein